MKIPVVFFTAFLTIQVCMADIPVDENGTYIEVFNRTNYLPWALGALGALAIMIFMYVYKKETHEK